MEILHHYNSDHESGSARVVVPLILEIIQPTSVIDVGCGIGQWLQVFNENGVNSILGLDGPHVLETNLRISKEYFQSVNLNLSKDIKLDTEFDLVLCLEVAEHLFDTSAKQLIEFLTNAGNNIIFSAAVPFQTGENHYNEQWPDYWQKLFKEQGYVFIDIFRDKIWNDTRVNWWYRQNLFLVTNDPGLVKQYSNKIFNGHSRVHPELLSIYIAENKRLLNLLSVNTERSNSKWNRIRKLIDSLK